MPEPVSHAVTSATIVTAAIIPLTGSIFGIPFPGLGFGFLGGIIALIYLEDTVWGSEPKKIIFKVGGSLLSSSLLGGIFSPLIVFAASEHYHIEGGSEVLPFLLIGAAAAIGFLSQKLAPALLKYAGTLGGRQEDK